MYSLSNNIILECNESNLSEALQYHIDTNTPLVENVFRYGSKGYFELYNEARSLYNEGKKVLLDFPMEINEAEYNGKKVNLNKPQRSSGPKKYQVYVKNKKGNVIKVNFGDAKGGLSAKISDKDARKAFADRHNCSDKKDRTKAGYWSCNLPRYGKSLGITQGNFYW